MTPEPFKGTIFFDKRSNKWAYCRYNRGYTTTYYWYQHLAENDALRDIKDDIITEVEVFTKAGYHKKMLGFYSVRKNNPNMPVQDVELASLVRIQNSTIEKQKSAIENWKSTAETWERIAESCVEKANKYDKIVEAIG